MSSVAQLQKAEQIQVLNDILRTTFVGGRVMLTAGVDALPVNAKASLLAAVRSFNTFTEDNDPQGEHDFGVIELDAERFFWKIDYYNLTLDGGSEDPASVTKTARVLTIMRAEEY